MQFLQDDKKSMIFDPLCSIVHRKCVICDPRCSIFDPGYLRAWICDERYGIRDHKPAILNHHLRATHTT